MLTPRCTCGAEEDEHPWRSNSRTGCATFTPEPRCTRCGCVYGQKGHDYCPCPEFTPEPRCTCTHEQEEQFCDRHDTPEPRADEDELRQALDAEATLRALNRTANERLNKAEAEIDRYRSFVEAFDAWRARGSKAPMTLLAARRAINEEKP